MAKTNAKAKKSTADTAVAHDPVADVLGAGLPAIAEGFAMPTPEQQAALAANLDRLLTTLDAMSQRQTPGLTGMVDAIDRELARTRRKTAVKSLTDDPVIQQFRTDLVDGLIRIDTLNQVLVLANTVITRFGVLA